MKRADKKRIEDINKFKLEKKAKLKENHAQELKPKETKEEFKCGNKVLVNDFNGELTGPFVIVELIGNLSCKLRFVVSSGLIATICSA